MCIAELAFVVGAVAAFQFLIKQERRALLQLRSFV